MATIKRGGIVICPNCEAPIETCCCEASVLRTKRVAWARAERYWNQRVKDCPERGSPELNLQVIGVIFCVMAVLVVSGLITVITLGFVIGQFIPWPEAFLGNQVFMPRGPQWWIYLVQGVYTYLLLIVGVVIWEFLRIFVRGITNGR